MQNSEIRNQNGSLYHKELDKRADDDKSKEPLLKVNDLPVTKIVNNDGAVYYKPPERERTSSRNPDDESGVKFLGLGDDSICSSRTTIAQKSKIPDGGWGWVVVVSAFVISTIADGLAFSFGLLHAEFVFVFQESQSKTSWIGSLFIAVPLIAGPIMSALVDRYGCRIMTIIGGIISAIGFILAALSQSIEMVFFTFGIIAGLGMGVCYVTAVVSVAYWFEKRRNLAVSLGSCGIGIGTVVYSPMTTYFLNEYGWRGTLVLLAGTILNLCICGAVMREPEWLIEEQKRRNKLSAISSMSISAKSAKSAAESFHPGLEEIRALLRSGEAPEYILTKLATSIAVAEDLNETTKMNADTVKPKVNSVISLPTFLKQSEKLPIEVLESLHSNKRLYNIILENYPSLLALRSSSEQKLNVEENKERAKKKPVTMSMKLKAMKKDKKDVKVDATLTEVLPTIPENKLIVPKSSQKQPRQEWLKRQLSGHHYLKDLRMHRTSLGHRGAMMHISKYRIRASSCPNIYRNSMLSLDTDEEEKTLWAKIKDELANTFDFSLLCDFHFMLMNLSTILLFVWFIVPYFYLISYMTENNYRIEDGTTMVQIIGAANTIGIVVLGWAGDQPWLNVTKAYALCLIICGVTIALYPILLANYWLLAINSAVFGITFASSYSYTPTILVELIALEKFTIAYGLILLSQGIGHLIGPPIAGLTYDMTSDWKWSFYLGGAWIVLSGLLVIIIPYTKNFRLCGIQPKDSVSMDAYKLDLSTKDDE